MDLGLTGKRAIVTGASKGIGRAIADTLAAEGCHVAICARAADGVAAAVEALKAKGVKAFGRAPDVTDRDALLGWVEASASELGGIDIAGANVSALAKNPWGRMATAQEVANAAAFLASPAASFVTGVNVVVDGALTRRVQF